MNNIKLEAEVCPTLVIDLDGQYYLVMADGSVTLEEALEQHKACAVPLELAKGMKAQFAKAVKDME
jgi:hypothetical protein